MTDAQTKTPPADVPRPDGRPCRRCACPLAFVMNGESGKTVPLDTRAPVYALIRTPQGFAALPFKRWLWNASKMDAEQAKGELDSLVAVHPSHWVTCPHSDLFNKARQDAAAKEFGLAELALAFCDYLEKSGQVGAEERPYVEGIREAAGKVKS